MRMINKVVCNVVCFQKIKLTNVVSVPNNVYVVIDRGMSPGAEDKEQRNRPSIAASLDADLGRSAKLASCLEDRCFITNSNYSSSNRKPLFYMASHTLGGSSVQKEIAAFPCASTSFV